MKTDKTADVMPEGRKKIVEYLKGQLFGPVNGPEEELIIDSPRDYYTVGILHPLEEKFEFLNRHDDSDGSAGFASEDSEPDDPVTLSNQLTPSSMGISFYFTGKPLLSIDVFCGRYERSNQNSWKRTSCSEKNIAIKNNGAVCTKKVLNGIGLLQVVWRQMDQGFLVTITFMNNQISRKENRNKRTEKTLFQAGFTCRIPEGEISNYPSFIPDSGDMEESLLKLIYRRKKTYGVGHGCSATWMLDENDLCNEISASAIPEVLVPQITFDLDERFPCDESVFSIVELSKEDVPKDELIDKLNAFADSYKRWIASLPDSNEDIPKSYRKSSDNIINALNESLKRIRLGIDILSGDSDAFQAFRFANFAMLVQMWRDRNTSVKKKRNEGMTESPNYFTINSEEFKWRPFQLAFMLMMVNDLWDQSSEFRDIVDVIWFPTGGGKTEAYLAASAFEIFARRLREDGNDDGTVIISRYTLRLLTSQQFERTAKFICACDYIRKNNLKILGNTPVSLGLWVGMSASPNRLSVAYKEYQQMRSAESPTNPFQLFQCPWCGTEIIPERRSADDKDYGIVCDETSFRFYCPSEDCEFHDCLPINIIDDMLYTSPPTFLIGTLDKFARLAYEEHAGIFFNKEGCLPPSLILQDELHLLSGPLGTIAAIYESSIHHLIEMQGMKPKIISSTATITRAQAQIKNLYGKKTRMFPHPGLDADDSFFARKNWKGARLYLGIMSQSTSPLTSLIRTTAALAQAPLDLELGDDEKDAYWTNVIYHNSLRELGKTATACNDDVWARVRVIAKTHDNTRNLTSDDVLEITSNLSAEKIPETTSRLHRTFNEPQNVSIATSSNMFSVGIDVPRLAIMTMNGQPKSSSEYIQATSRVGRDIERPPGLIVTHFSFSKARDRSHYETFTGYHQQLYRFVEPVSITPYTVAARERSLHAALIIIIRHGVGLQRNEDAGSFSKNDNHTKTVLENYLEKIHLIDKNESNRVLEHMEKLIERWHTEAKTNGDALRYFSLHRQYRSLMGTFDSDPETSNYVWPTLNSMRNVDMQVPLSVLGEQ
tara:strand:- start:589 stop:3753 length:3165 start_codon:yes stop_codon:yes gene_type:complete